MKEKISEKERKKKERLSKKIYAEKTDNLKKKMKEKIRKKEEKWLRGYERKWNNAEMIKDKWHLNRKKEFKEKTQN